MMDFYKWWESIQDRLWPGANTAQAETFAHKCFDAAYRAGLEKAAEIADGYVDVEFPNDETCAIPKDIAERIRAQAVLAEPKGEVG